MYDDLPRLDVGEQPLQCWPLHRAARKAAGSRRGRRCTRAWSRGRGEAPNHLANSPHALRQGEGPRYDFRMTTQLQEAIRLARTLSEEEQDRFAQMLVAFAHGIDEQERVAE